MVINWYMVNLLIKYHFIVIYVVNTSKPVRSTGEFQVNDSWISEH